MLAPPEDLERYARHLPDAAERLLAASEREQAHRHQLEDHLARMRAQELPHEHACQQRTCLITLVLGLAFLGVTATAIANRTLTSAPRFEQPRSSPVLPQTSPQP